MIMTVIMISSPTAVTGISIRETFFQSEILPNCYKLDMQRKLYLLGQSSPAGPLGQSLENFISLIEKIEDFDNGRRLAGTRPDVIARMILSRFHIDEYNYVDHSGVFYQENIAATRNRLTEILLEAASSPTEPLSEDDWKTVLTTDEKCSMYFMLSHNVNRTALPSDRRTYMAAPVNPNVWAGGNPNRNANLLRASATSTLMTENAREYGVVGFRNDETHAVAPARLLLGIVGANTNRQTVSSIVVLKEVGMDIPLMFRESAIDVPLVVTLGEVWGFGAAPSTSEEKEGINFGASGTWNSTLCQVEYKLRTNYTKGSLAEIRGAVDGYLLGIKSREAITKGNFKLSSLLRQYYSPTGLFDEFTSVCNRRKIDQETTTIKDQTRNYLSLLLKASRIPIGEDRITNLVDMSQKEFENALREATTPIRNDVDWCSKTKNTDPSGGICETPSDVVVVIDTMAQGDGLLTQMDIVKRLSNELDMRRYASTMTVVAATRNGGYMEDSQSYQSSDTLSRIAWNTTNRGCATCRFAFADFANFGSPFNNQPDQLLKYLNATLRDLKRGKAGLRSAAGRPVVFFNYGALRKSAGDRRSLEAAKWDLEENHRDVPILMAGEAGMNQDDLKAYVRDEKRDVFLIDPDVRGVTELLSKRICETPAVIQHPSCRIETSSSMSSTHYITRGRKQYFAMYPEYFLKSFNIVFEIKAVNGPIKVCYRRGYERPEEDERNCEKLDPKGTNNIKTMRSANPCYKFSLHDCPPFYFTIIAPDEGGNTANKCLSKWPCSMPCGPLVAALFLTTYSNSCLTFSLFFPFFTLHPATGTEDQCLNMDQVEWQFSHTGVSCNSVGKLASSFLLLLTTALVSYRIKDIL